MLYSFFDQFITVNFVVALTTKQIELLFGNITTVYTTFRE